MADRKRTPLSELFTPKTADVNENIEENHIQSVQSQIEKFEKKTNANWKKGPAPLPPGHTKIQLPKIGNYKPKSLISEPLKRQESKTSDTSDNTYCEAKDVDILITERHRSERTNSESSNSNFILNKNVSKEPTDDQEMDDSGFTTPVKEKYSENPLFGLDEPSTPVHSDLESEPLILSPPVDYLDDTVEDDDTPIPAPRRKRSKGQRAPSPPPQPPQINEGFVPEEPEQDYPYIPEPDYDEDEMTMTFNGHAGIGRPSSYHGLSTVTEGEDFSKYLSDEDDYEFDTLQMRRNNNKYNKHNRENRPPNRRPRSNPRPQSSNVDLRPIGKGKKDSKKEEMRRYTIRDFTFADSKIGYDDRTVRSTSAKGRYMKHRDRSRIPEGSYEEFLRNRHNNEEGSNSSNDSGHVTEEDAALNKLFQNNQHRLKDGKNSIWKKLTWRFKRHSNGYDMS